MEEIVHSGIQIDIERILNIFERFAYCEVLVRTKKEECYKIVFERIFDLRCSFQSAYLDRLSKLRHNESVKSSVVLIAHSQYCNFMEKETLGMVLTEEMKDYMITDDNGYIVEVIQENNQNSAFPKLIKLPSKKVE